MLTRILVVAAAGIAAAVLAGPVTAAQPDLPVVEIIEQDMDAKGHALGPPRVVPASEHAKHRPDAADLRGEKVRGPAVAKRSARSLQSSGCRSVSIARVGRSLFGSVIYKYWQDKYWCWSYPKVTSASVGVHVGDVDPFWYYRGTVASQGWYFNWCCGSGTSGHYSLRQGKFENVIAGRLLSSEYPWVKIWARGDGSYSYETGK